MKGIILAGGSGTRLYPITKGISKQLLSIYDKPMVYYPLSVLMLAGINDILIISTPSDLPNFKKLLGSGSDWGITLSYAEQPSPDGLAQAFIIGKDFIGNEDVCLVLGDNIFYGQNFPTVLKNAITNVKKANKATVFGFFVNEPKSYGVVEFNEFNEAISLEEKPITPKSNYAVIGLYFYPNSVIKIAENIKPSKRGELEITSVNQEYLRNNNLQVEVLEKEFMWLDSGTHDSLLEASNFIQTIEKRTGLKVACLEEIAYKKGYISKEKLKSIIKPLIKTNYGKYLINKVL